LPEKLCGLAPATVICQLTARPAWRRQYFFQVHPRPLRLILIQQKIPEKIIGINAIRVDRQGFLQVLMGSKVSEHHL
jgi:hypothetical protein